MVGDRGTRVAHWVAAKEGRKGVASCLGSLVGLVTMRKRKRDLPNSSSKGRKEGCCYLLEQSRGTSFHVSRD